MLLRVAVVLWAVVPLQVVVLLRVVVSLLAAVVLRAVVGIGEFIATGGSVRRSSPLSDSLYRAVSRSRHLHPSLRVVHRRVPPTRTGSAMGHVVFDCGRRLRAVHRGMSPVRPRKRTMHDAMRMWRCDADGARRLSADPTGGTSQGGARNSGAARNGTLPIAEALRVARTLPVAVALPITEVLPITIGLLVMERYR